MFAYKIHIIVYIVYFSQAKNNLLQSYFILNEKNNLYKTSNLSMDKKDFPVHNITYI